MRTSTLTRGGALGALLAMAHAPALAASGGEGEDLSFIWILILVYGLIVVFRRLQQLGIPRVICALIAGMALSAVGYYADLAFVDLVRTSHVLFIFGTIGMIKVIFRAGEHESLAEMRKVGLLASLVAVIGVAAPGFAVYYLVKFIRPEAATLEVLLIACTMVATSIALATALFRDMGIINHRAAKIVIAAAVVDDILGLVILSAVVAYAESGVISMLSIGMMVFWSIAFIAVALLAGELLAGHLSRWFSRLGADRQTMYQYVIIVMLAGAWIAHGFGHELIIGAFVAGVALKKVHFEHYEAPELVTELEEISSRTKVEKAAVAQELTRSIGGNGGEEGERQRDLLAQLGRIMELEEDEIGRKLKSHKDNDVRNMLEQGSWLFEEVFFFKIGLGISFAVFSLGLLMPVALITVVALAMKLVSGLIVPGTISVKLLIGAGMGPRGEVGLIFAEVGRDIGALSGEGFAIGVMTVVATTLIAPFIISYLGRRVRHEEEEVLLRTA